jgi:hypothetical protein
LSLTETVPGSPPTRAANIAVASIAVEGNSQKRREVRTLRALKGRLLRIRLVDRSTPTVRLALLSLLAVAVHGYHLGADDAGVYLPAVLKVIHPGLYPYGAEFFLSHARLSQFALVVGTSARLSHLNDDLVIFLWHFATIFLFLFAAWRLAMALFLSGRARWSAVLMSAATLTVPVAGTALVIMDPYLTARSASTPLTMLAVAACLDGKRLPAFLWIALAFLAHPLMASYSLLCLGVLAIPDRWSSRLFPFPSTASPIAAAVPIAFSFGSETPAYRQALSMRRFLFLSQWAWWEWIGVAVPIAILASLGSVNLRGATPAFRKMTRALVLLGVIATLFGILFSSSPAMERFAWLQPMRAFHLIYIIFFLLLGGLVGEFLLNFRSWLRTAVFASFCLGIFAGIFMIQRNVYANSRHIEWPWAPPINPWVSAFEWARDNTPENAVFALDPRYIVLPGEDQHGFRAIARRSVLSDYYKDSGVVSLFPQLAEEWQGEQMAQQGWPRFQLTDFQRLARRYPVSWVIVEGAAPPGMNCPYRNQAVSVCHIPGAMGLNKASGDHP